MKKIIASVCTLAAIGFAVALANADENTPSAGTTASTDTTTTQTDSSGNKMSSTSKWKNVKTCTDSDGITYYRGKQGYENCTAQMKKPSKKSDQMSGTEGVDTNRGVDANTPSDSNMSSSGSSDSMSHSPDSSK
jgi:hypothetical protein